MSVVYHKCFLNQHNSIYSPVTISWSKSVYDVDLILFEEPLRPIQEVFSPELDESKGMWNCAPFLFVLV